MSDSVDVLTAATDSFKEKKPLLYAATAANVEALGNLAKAAGCPLVAKGDGSLDSVIALTEKLSAMGLKDIVIDTGTRELKKAFEEQILIRRAALKDRFRPLGFPTIIMANEMGDGIMEEALVAATFVAKYGAVMVYERPPAACDLPSSSRTAQYLHRPAAADDSRAGNLSDQQPRRKLSGARDLQLLADLLSSFPVRSSPAGFRHGFVYRTPKASRS